VQCIVRAVCLYLSARSTLELSVSSNSASSGGGGLALPSSMLQNISTASGSTTLAFTPLGVLPLLLLLLALLLLLLLAQLIACSSLSSFATAAASEPGSVAVNATQYDVLFTVKKNALCMLHAVLLAESVHQA
jgi:hypothetical protein